MNILKVLKNLGGKILLSKDRRNSIFEDIEKEIDKRPAREREYIKVDFSLPLNSISPIKDDPPQNTGFPGFDGQ